MKVLCINDKWTSEFPGWPSPEVGDIDTVVREVEVFGTLFYQIERFEGWGFWSEHFAPLSDIDETELVNEKEMAV